jgi:hypothetical protein
MTGSGGWPLTIVMTPDRKPFFAATYIPRESRFGRIGLTTLIPQIKQMWEKKHQEVTNSADQITTILQQTSVDSPRGTLDESILKTTYELLEQSFDEKYGGFGNYPKFPTPHNLFFLLRYWKRKNEQKALNMVEQTLQAMRNGGIYDHVGFGFHRYSTDNKWLLPHFEKMLYDQALLAIAYIEAYQATRKKDYERTAREIFEYVLRDMTAPEGGFYSAQDADSEGTEGKFYVWTYEEINEILGEEAKLVIDVFNIKKDGNFSEQETHNANGTNILYSKDLTSVAKTRGISINRLTHRINTARHKLFDARKRRTHPHKDDKILTSWNGLMIAALARGAQVFDNTSYAKTAEKAALFVLNNLTGSEKRLLHRYRDGHSAVTANLDDYAFLIWGLIELYEATFDTRVLEYALNLNEELIQHFWDDNHGGFYFTADDVEHVLVRQKFFYDSAIPSGNSIEIYNLLRLGKITANPGYYEMAAKTISLIATKIKHSPLAYTQFMSIFDSMIGPSYEVVIVGDLDENDTKRMIMSLSKPFIPNKVVVFRPNDAESPDITRFARFTKHQTSIDGKATAYVCSNYDCKSPTTEINRMLKFLGIETELKQ